MRKGAGQTIALSLLAAPFLLYGIAQTSRVHDAVQSGSLEGVANALKPWKSLNGRNRYGSTPLELAMAKKNLAIAKFLLERGATIQFTTHSGERIDHVVMAVRTRNVEALRLLLERGGRPHRGALEEAVRSGDLEIVLTLLDHRAIPDPGLSVALELGKTNPTRLAVADLLVKRGARWPMQRADGSSFIQLVILKHDVEALRWMIERGYPVNDQDGRGNTALHHAAGTVGEVMSLLIKAGAKPNVRNQLGFTPLTLTVQKGHLTNALLLLQAGADPNLGPPGSKPIEIAHKTNQYIFLGPLREYGAKE